MKKYLKFLIFLSILLTLILFIFYFFLNYYHDKKIIKKVSSTFDEICVQNNIRNNNTISSLSIPADELNAIGFIKIEKINFEGLVYEGTNSDILKKGVGHFECSPITKR